MAWYQDPNLRFETPEMLLVARWPSVILGALGCVAIFGLGALGRDRRTGAVAALLLMVNPLYRLHARRAMADIQEVLNREPRHFGALAGLGMILEEVGENKQALEAYRKALAVNPHMQKIPEQVKALSEKVEGRDI